MITKKQNMEVATLSKETSTPDVLAILQKELSSLQAINDSVYKTNGNLEPFGDIKNEKKIENLRRALGSVINREEIYNKGVAREAELMGGECTAPVFKLNGSSVADWEHDIIIQIKKVTYEERYNELKELMKEAKEFLSIDDKKEMFYNKLKNKLG